MREPLEGFPRVDGRSGRLQLGSGEKADGRRGVESRCGAGAGRLQVWRCLASTEGLPFV